MLLIGLGFHCKFAHSTVPIVYWVGVAKSFSLISESRISGLAQLGHTCHVPPGGIISEYNN